MTDAQLKALKFVRDTDALNYERASHWQYQHREKLPCTGGALKVLIRALEAKGWISPTGALTDQGNQALTDYVNEQAARAARDADGLNTFEA